MRAFLDDESPTHEGWMHARWPENAIAFLKTGNVTHPCLDYDLGDDVHGTGYNVVIWLKQAVALEGFSPPIMTLHSSNSSARLKMFAGIEAINRLAKESTALH
jgi:hypothetical protein